MSARPTPDPARAAEPISFEDSIRRLGDIVKRLEEGELSLEESLQAFERGIALARDAQHRLDAAEARVDELLSVDEQGRAITRPLGRRSDPSEQHASGEGRDRAASAEPSASDRLRGEPPAERPSEPSAQGLQARSQRMTLDRIDRATPLPAGDEDDLPF